MNILNIFGKNNNTILNNEIFNKVNSNELFGNIFEIIYAPGLKIKDHLKVIFKSYKINENYFHLELIALMYCIAIKLLNIMETKRELRRRFYVFFWDTIIPENNVWKNITLDGVERATFIEKRRLIYNHHLYNNCELLSSEYFTGCAVFINLLFFNIVENGQFLFIDYDQIGDLYMKNKNNSKIFSIINTLVDNIINTEVIPNVDKLRNYFYDNLDKILDSDDVEIYASPTAYNKR